MIRNIILYTLLLGTLLFNTSCEKDATAATPAAAEAPAAKDAYVSSELLLSVPKETLQAFTASKGQDQYLTEIKYGVSVYKLIYTTTYQGREIQASGLVCVPQGMTAPAPVISAQHGTIFRQSEAPTSFTGLSGFEAFAAGGFITLVPDYIGFGASKDIFHPYYDQKHSALAVVDMIKAAKTFYKKQQVQANDKLFLVGYSEGGYVTLAAQKEIETHPEHGLQVTASAAGAGGYDLVHMLSGIKSGQAYTYPAYLAYILQAYNHTNNWNRPLTELFQEPYASKLPALFDGVKGGSAINRELTTDTKKLFNPTFFAALQDDKKELALKQALQANSFYDWVPQSPTRLYHGTTDNIVPFQNSQVTYDRFKQQGAKNLELIPIKGQGHGSAFVPMLKSLVPWLQQF
ncbi:alpha/beta fold hydrolase [Pontibacter akesuensis]|uniref:alpha/beta fold hydrolase n=1 Tax=Pontibacter akesuensis TaxID=388950 RepID=UPI001FD4A527|nr:alpha/beta fold hydrolase [Pontibacter akesuensis]